MAKEIETLDALIFIDTNILLDFYRIRKSNVSLKYLQQIKNHLDLLITSSQVEMEFKKNRQTVILESITEIKKIGTVTGKVPAILSDSKTVEMIGKSREDIKKRQKKLRDKIEQILKSPVYSDQVYKSLQKLFNHKSKINLNRDNKKRVEIRDLAKKRFILGYPPRKKSDNWIGDAVNWEWIISCAIESGKHIIVVTRDSDFGCVYDGKSYLNDWLQQEFKQRVSRKRKVVLTDKLSEAFQLVKIPVTEEMIQEEKNVIEQSFKNYLNLPFQNPFLGLSNEFSNSEWMQAMRHLQEISKKWNIEKEDDEGYGD